MSRTRGLELNAGTGGRYRVRSGTVGGRRCGTDRTFHYAKSNLKGTAQGTERRLNARFGGESW